MKRYLHVLVIGLGIFAIVCSNAKAADWPNYRGTNYDGISTETGWSSTWPEAGPKVLWKHSLGIGFASMAVSNGKVYATGNINDKDFLTFRIPTFRCFFDIFNKLITGFDQNRCDDLTVNNIHLTAVCFYIKGLIQNLQYSYN